MKFLKVIVDESECMHCGFCTEVNKCVNPSCAGCLACFFACPYEARKIVEDHSARKYVRIIIDGVEYEVPERITIKRALELCGYEIGVYPGEGDVQAPCNVGGCYTCLIAVDEGQVRSCITAVKDGMKIKTDTGSITPLRIIHGPQPHAVGGKATPWTEKRGERYIEVAIWTAGCNLRCPQCQNFRVTYDSSSIAVTPREAARLMTYHRRKYGVNGMAISGGEPTLNKRWLIEYFRELKKLNPDEEARLHLDSNGTLLISSYIDDLVRAGCNNFGVEPKGLYADTFMRITRITDRELAERYLRTSWEAARYLIDNYRHEVYIGIGIPYNLAFMSFDELAEIGEKIVSMDPTIQVCVLDYFPTFRLMNIKRPSYDEMLKVKKVLNDAGLSRVLVQTELGHVGP